MKLKYKIWLEKDEEKVFGDGPLDILQRIERVGSLRKAAEEINMSYSQAWTLIKSLENRLGLKLLKSKAGGEYGGGSELTAEARDLMAKFEIFRGKVKENLELLYQEVFKEE